MHRKGSMRPLLGRLSIHRIRELVPSYAEQPCASIPSAGHESAQGRESRDERLGCQVKCQFVLDAASTEERDYRRAVAVVELAERISVSLRRD
jgi:hypothetical protein